MPNHVTTVGLCCVDWSKRPNGEPDLTALNDKICEAVLPPPLGLQDGLLCYWCAENYGSKWGVYDVKVTQLSGDGQPYLIEWLTAWSPLKPGMLGLVEEYLHDKCGLHNFRWMYFNPYDEQTHYLISE